LLDGASGASLYTLITEYASVEVDLGAFFAAFNLNDGYGSCRAISNTDTTVRATLGFNV
jgi:hypothetical protein